MEDVRESMKWLDVLEETLLHFLTHIAIIPTGPEDNTLCSHAVRTGVVVTMVYYSNMSRPLCELGEGVATPAGGPGGGWVKYI